VSRKKPSVIFSTTDAWGNLVHLKEETWVNHVIVEHADMTGYEVLVRQLIEDPELIRESTAYAHGAGFISSAGVGPRPEGIRAIVSYNNASYEKGASTGYIATAYPIDIIRYSSPQLGRIIYKKPKGGSK
jgi:hypothetical protein